MGLLLISKNADFSASPVGHAGLYTSVTSGLKALHETRRSASKAANNSAPGGAKGSVIGSPTYSAGSAIINAANSVVFGAPPASGGLTLAVIVKIKTGGVINDGIAGIDYTGSATTKGCAFFGQYNQRVSFLGYSYPAGSVAPLSGYSTLSVNQDFATNSIGAYELFFGVLENNVSLRLYHPKTTTLTAAAAVGRDFSFDAPPLLRTCPTNTANTQDVALFSHWNRVLTPAEMNTFYGEMQPQYAKLGVVI